MGLYKTALRLATLEGLRPTSQLTIAAPETPSWPTLACDYVFDSRIDPLDDANIRPGDRRAVIVVYTDGDEGYGSQYRGGNPFRRIVDLCFEISQIAWAPSDQEGEGYIVGIPQTDAELEAELDRIEAEISLALFYAPSGSIWRKLTGRMVSDPRSVHYRDSEEGVRLARRSLQWKVQVPDDRFLAMPFDQLTGLSALPQPLQDVAQQLLDTSYGAALALALGQNMPQMPIATPLTTVGINTEIIKSGAQQKGTPNLSGEVTLNGASPNTFDFSVSGDAGISAADTP